MIARALYKGLDRSPLSTAIIPNKWTAPAQPKAGFHQVIFVSIFGSFHSSLSMLKRIMSVHFPRTKSRFRIMPSLMKPTFSRILCDAAFLI